MKYLLESSKADTYFAHNPNFLKIAHTYYFVRHRYEINAESRQKNREHFAIGFSES